MAAFQAALVNGMRLFTDFCSIWFYFKLQSSIECENKCRKKMKSVFLSNRMSCHWLNSLSLSLSLYHIDYCAASHSFNDKVMWIEKNSIPNAIQSPYNEEPRKRWSEQERSEKKIMWKTWICEQPTDLMRIKRLTYASLPFSLFVFLACELRFFIL